jgi:hypothetical protein
LGTIKIPAARVRQGALILYATAMKVRDLVSDNFYSVETLDPENANDNGYQRVLNTSRAKKLADYILKGQDKPTLELIEGVSEQSVPAGKILLVNYGAQMSSRKKGEFGKDYVLRDECASPTCKKTISGRNLYRYDMEWAGQYVEWSLAPKMYGSREPWFFETHKLMVRDITGTHRLELAIDRAGMYCDHTILCALRFCDVREKRESEPEAIALSKLYSLDLLQGLLASRLVSAFYYWVLTGEGVRTGGGFHTYPTTIRALPLFDIRKANTKQKKILKQIEADAKALSKLGLKPPVKLTPQQAKAIARRATALDNRIDSNVFELYGLSEAQIASVIAATGGA